MGVELATWLFSGKAQQTRLLKLGQQKYLGAGVPIKPKQNKMFDFAKSKDAGTILEEQHPEVSE